MCPRARDALVFAAKSAVPSLTHSLSLKLPPSLLLDHICFEESSLCRPVARSTVVGSWSCRINTHFKPHLPCSVSTFDSLHHHRARNQPGAYRIDSLGLLSRDRYCLLLASPKSQWLLFRVSPLARSLRPVCRRSGAPRTGRTVRRDVSRANECNTKRAVQPCRPSLRSLRVR